MVAGLLEGGGKELGLGTCVEFRLRRCESLRLSRGGSGDFDDFDDFVCCGLNSEVLFRFFCESAFLRIVLGLRGEFVHVSICCRRLTPSNRVVSSRASERQFVTLRV